jgi:hypothetical protein
MSTHAILSESATLDLSWFTTPQLHTHSDPVSSAAADVTVSELVIIGQRPAGWPTDNLPIGSIAFEDGYYGLWIKSSEDTGPGYSDTYNPTPNDHKIEVLVPGQRGVETAKAAAEVIAKIDKALLYNLSELGSVNTRIGTVLGSDVRQDWQALQVKVVESVPRNPNAQMAIDPVGDHPILYITPKILDYGGYARELVLGGKGMEYAILHEMAHITGPGLQWAWQQQFDWMQQTGNTNLDQYYAEPNVQLQAQENGINNIAVSIGLHIGIDIRHPDITYGW